MLWGMASPKSVPPHRQRPICRSYRPGRQRHEAGAAAAARPVCIRSAFGRTWISPRTIVVPGSEPPADHAAARGREGAIRGACAADQGEAGKQLREGPPIASMATNATALRGLVGTFANRSMSRATGGDVATTYPVSTTIAICSVKAVLPPRLTRIGAGPTGCCAEPASWYEPVCQPGSRKDPSGADLIGAQLAGQDLRGAKPRGADLIGERHFMKPDSAASLQCLTEVIPRRACP